MNLEEKQELLAQFLERWPESAVERLTLPQYVGVRDKDTFTYWVETLTRPLGSIKGTFSDKFGIYLRSKPAKLSKNRTNDNQYTWMPRLGKSRQEAFRTVKQELLSIIRFAATGDFAKIDGIHLHQMFKWKVASLYSNERLVPIFKQEVLSRIADAYGLATTSKTQTSEIHALLINRKPSDQDIYSYMEALYERYGSEHHKEPISRKPQGGTNGKPAKTRKGVATKNIAAQLRNPARSC